MDIFAPLQLQHDPAPAIPSADEIAFAMQRIHVAGGRVLPRVINEDGALTTLQSHRGRNSILAEQATGSSVITSDFGSAMTAVGTATARSPATTNKVTRTRRTAYVSAATAGAAAGRYSATAAAMQATLGSGTILAGGGFLAAFRWAASDAATVAGAHMLVGMQSTVAAPVAATNPNALTNVIGVAQLNGGANLNMVYGGSAAQAPVDLGANFPAAGLSTDLYELILYASPTLNNAVAYRVERLNTGHVASGILTGVAGTALPANTTFLNPRMWRSNNATALAVGIDIVSMYLETDFA